jgi:hypothetical protein
MLCWSATARPIHALTFYSHSLMAWASASKAMGLGKVSSQHIPSPFLSNAAEFVAAAGSIPSIPPSMRLPEVAETARHHSYSLDAHYLKRLL